MLKKMLEDMAGRAGLLNRGHVLRIEATALPPQSKCDPNLTRLALGNLTDNAVKHTPPGSTVILRGGRDTQGVWLEVEDNGGGLYPEDLARIFDPGYRRNPQVPGTGYGLTLAREMIEIQGGNLTAESVVGRGTRFRIRLPQELLPRTRR